MAIVIFLYCWWSTLGKQWIRSLPRIQNWNLSPARRIDSQYQTSYTDNRSLDPVHGRTSGRHKAKGPEYVLQQPIRSTTSCWLRMRGATPTWGSGGECKSLLTITVEMAPRTGMSRIGCGEFRKSTVWVVQIVKACTLKWSRRQSRGLVRKNPAIKVLASGLQNGCPI
jgi:hypothetical protein